MFIYLSIYFFIYTEIWIIYWAQHNFLFVVARLLALKHHFLLRSCCYDLGFRTLLLLTFQHSSLYCVCCCSALDFQIRLPTTFCCYTLGFPTQLPVFCCCALDFQTPTMVLLLRSGVSNETSDYVSAARLLSFHHKLALLCLLLQCSRLSRITSCWLLLRF